MSGTKRTGRAGFSPLAAMVFACVIILASPAYSLTRYVTNLDDSGPGSLRDTVAAALSLDIVDCTGISGEILLTTGQIGISDKSITIIGPGAKNLAISGNNSSRIFSISGVSFSVTISGITLKDGHAKGTDGAAGAPSGGGFPGLGGAIYVEATVSGSFQMLNCAVLGNVAEGGTGGEGTGEAGGGGGGAGMGGGLYFADNVTATVEGCLISGNQALGGMGGFMHAAGGAGAGLGGGLFNESSQVDLINCTIANNSAQGGAGQSESTGYTPYLDSGSAGLWGQGGQGNGGGGNGGFGGGGGGGAPIWGQGGNGGYGGGGGLGESVGLGGDSGGNAMSGVSSGGGAGMGGGLFTYMSGSTYLLNCTVSGNITIRGLDANGETGSAAGTGKGGGAVEQGVSSTTVKNTIIHGNQAPDSGPDVYGQFISWGYNHVTNTVDSTGWGGMDTNTFDPMLMPLADNGGPTLTMALDEYSSMVNTGDDSFAPATDQRGFPRPMGLASDKGAYEFDFP
ncbi:MAG: choice-of-anchor Q domain-containing protein, partial [Thermodesulfobacteriota bacterium]